MLKTYPANNATISAGPANYKFIPRTRRVAPTRTMIFLAQTLETGVGGYDGDTPPSGVTIVNPVTGPGQTSENQYQNQLDNCGFNPDYCPSGVSPLISLPGMVCVPSASESYTYSNQYGTASGELGSEPGYCMTQQQFIAGITALPANNGNSKKNSTGSKYAAFLACEASETVANLDEDPTPGTSKDEPYTFSVVNSAPFIFAARGQGVRALVAAGVAAIYDISYAVRNRETCVQQVYGPGYF